MCGRRLAGLKIAVRYITNAHDRGQMRAKLNQVLVDLLGAKEPAAGSGSRRSKFFTSPFPFWTKPSYTPLSF